MSAFNLESQIAAWRRKMIAGKVRRPEVLEELECHLRDETAEQMRNRIEEVEAFDRAARKIGEAAVLRREFEKLGWFSRFMTRASRAAFRFAGVPNQYTDTSMNDSSSSPESRWATYLRSAVFVAPAIALWMLAAVFIMPKLNEIWFKSGMPNGTLASGAEGLVSLYRFNFGLVFFVKDHLFVILSALIVALGLLEWQSKIWPRLRRVTFGMGAFIFNLAALLSFFVMFLAATFVAAQLMQHVK